MLREPLFVPGNAILLNGVRLKPPIGRLAFPDFDPTSRINSEIQLNSK
jgi:hypothetical protein